MNILFINSCLRGKTISRTYSIASAFIGQVKKSFPSAVITQLDLGFGDVYPMPLTAETFAQRELLATEKSFSDPVFDMANQFVLADYIVIAAPLWENSFPAILRAYLENVSVAGLAFKYSENGSVGLCSAKKMVYITTRGGYATGNFAYLEMGARYLKTVCELYGIDSFETIAAEGIDIWGNDVQKLLNDAKIEAVSLGKGFCL